MKRPARALPGSESSWWLGSHPASILQHQGCGRPGLMKKPADEIENILQGKKEVMKCEMFFILLSVIKCRVQPLDSALVDQILLRLIPSSLKDNSGLYQLESYFWQSFHILHLTSAASWISPQWGNKVLKWTELNWTESNCWDMGTQQHWYNVVQYYKKHERSDDPDQQFSHMF